MPPIVTSTTATSSPSSAPTSLSPASTTSTADSHSYQATDHRRVTMCPASATESSSAAEGYASSGSKPPSETELEDLEMGKATTPNVVTVSTRKDNGNLPRLVLRNRPFHQSSNKVHIQHNQGISIYALLKHNWFHVFLRWPTSRSLLTLMTAWTGAILFFAGVYVWYDQLEPSISCGLGLVDDPMTFAAAFAFSLETCTTVGYGLPHGINSYFEEGCSSLQVIIYFQMAWSMIFNAFLITFLYSRIGRAEGRATQVICSDKALVSVVDGQVRLQVRLFDADAQHPVVEAHVRFYCIMKHRPVPRPLRLLQPDDELGGMLFLSFPTVVNHHIDLYSLLHPPTASMTMNPQGLTLRQVDGTTAGRDDVICPVCGESYGTVDRWKNHVRYQQIVEAKDDYPTDGTHLSIHLEQLEQQTGLQATENLAELKEYFERNVSEVICVVEGIDPMQSGTFQSLQSYRMEDIVWESHAQFAPCLTILETNKNQRVFQVDLDRYHDIVPDEEASKAPAAQQSQSSSTRRRRVKTISRRTSDCLFESPSDVTSTENSNHPKSMSRMMSL